MKDWLAKLIVTGLGAGYMRPAPGSWASATVCAIFLGVMWLGGGNLPAVNATMAGVLVLASVGCVALGRQAERMFGKKDPSQCVIDEWAGQALALLLLPLPTGLPAYQSSKLPSGEIVHSYRYELAGSRPWWHEILLAVGIAFLAFRLLDIIKPPPARQLEKLPHGWGVLLDDLAAGLYANVVCQLILRLGFHLT
ncbi:MAG: phosphatidylglycerophosphatase A [Phycisphaerae bacterium]